MSERMKDLAVSDNGFVFDPWTGSSFSLNESGLCLLRGLQEGLGRAALAARLRERFELRDGAGAPAADLERDVDEFLNQLRRNELLGQDEEVAP
jgi:PqqD family protein of HPr-rel-A system